MKPPRPRVGRGAAISKLRFEMVAKQRDVGVRALVQRVARASVAVGGEVVGQIGEGLVVFLGIGQGDGEEDARYIVDKVVSLRIFDDEDGRFNRSAMEVAAQLLLVSQFTLYADVRRGRRPSFSGAASPQEAEALFERAVELFKETGLRAETGRFQQRMLVDIQNEGPVTIMLDSADRHRPRRG
ncbi:MAG: D-tyrosyl-tRNA(Tyr) deacylase [Dehalococcoidia bacterium]|nr:D-tyrosyl-tRNA(Tyr) deacylase [Dehalococcoidia bacterium]